MNVKSRQRIAFALVVTLQVIGISACGGDDVLEQFGDYYHRLEVKRLTGIQEVEISITSSGDTDSLDVQGCDIYSICDSSLRSVGISVVSLEESFKRLDEGPPFDPVAVLAVRIQVLEAVNIYDRQHGVFFAVDMDCLQEVRLVRDTTIGMNAQTWNLAYIGSATRADVCAQLQATVREGLAVFATLYKEANH
jgi:hypothetical protein